MDEEKRRRRNKKKKNKQSGKAAGEDAAVAAASDGETGPVDLRSRFSNGGAPGNEVSDAGQDAEADRIKTLANGVEDVSI